MGRGGLFFVPQRPYITQGTLRQQIVYPSTLSAHDAVDEDIKVRGALVTQVAAAALSFDLCADCRD